MNDDGKAQTAAAIDIGSNSIKMTVARPDGNGGIEQIDWASEVVRLGEGLEQSGRLDDGRIQLAVDTISRFLARARQLGVDQVVAVATEATRAATNGQDFLDRVRDETGIDVQVLDGDEESALTFRGISATTDVSGIVVVADIGGGSTELIVARDGAVRSSRSIPLGSGRLTDRIVVADPPSTAEISASELAAAEAIGGVAGDLKLPKARGARLIVVGGTGEFMARLVPDERSIGIATIRAILNTLSELPAAELARKIDIPEARARLLPAGVAIVAAIAERVQPARIEVSRSGIRAGLLAETFRQAARRSPDSNGRTQPIEVFETKPSTKTEAETAKERAPASFRETMKALIGERWRAVWKAIPVALEGTDVEGVHDVRVASRRLRAAMDIAAPAFPQGWYKTLHRTAKEITGALGEVRDRDVMLEAFRADRAAAPMAEHPGIDRVIDRIEGERQLARIEMEAYLRELMAGPLRETVERRLGSSAVTAEIDAPSHRGNR